MGAPTPSRLIELLDAVKGEYDQLAQEVIICKNQRDEYEHKSENWNKKTSIRVFSMLNLLQIVNSQIQEMNLFQQNLIDLERAQQLIKKQYVGHFISIFG
jgi:glucose repression regulatory protein TUP1